MENVSIYLGGNPDPTRRRIPTEIPEQDSIELGYRLAETFPHHR